ncbi:MAG: hypothetical protein ACO1OG_08540 [Devosia sp.]
MGLSDFVNSVSDPFRGGAATSGAQTTVHGAIYQAASPALAAWLPDYPLVAEALADTSSAVSALEGIHEGGLTSFSKGRERHDDAKADEARLHHDARELGQAPDPEQAKRKLAARKATAADLEVLATRSSTGSQNFAVTRDEFSETIKFANGLAYNKSTVVLADPVKLPKGSYNDIVATQRAVIAKEERQQAEIEAAWMPVEDAVATIRASVVVGSPQLHIGPRGASWTAPQQRLNVEARVGDGPIDIDNTTALLGWLMGDALADRLEAEVRARYANHTGKTYTAAERRNAMIASAARLDLAERVEVTALRAAWAAGNFIPLRKGTSPMALLGIAKVVKATPKPDDIGSAYLGETRR